MDKTYFKKQSLKEANQHPAYYKTLSKAENAIIFKTMMQVAYGFVGKEWPPMEKVFTGMRKIYVE